MVHNTKREHEGLRRSSTQGDAAPQDEFLTVPEVARVLKIARGQAYDLVARGSLKAIMVNQRTIRVRRSDLERYLNGRDYLEVKQG